MSADNVKAARNERTYSRRIFNGLNRRLNDEIGNESTKELLEALSGDLKDAKKDVLTKHKEFIQLSITSDAEEDETAEDTYLNEVENEYYTTERNLFKYLQSLAESKQQDSLRDNEIAAQAKIYAEKSKQEALISSLCNIRSAEAALLETEFTRAIQIKDNAGESSVTEIESEMKALFDKVSSTNMKIIEAMKGEDAATEISWLVKMRMQYQSAMSFVMKFKDSNSKSTISNATPIKEKGYNLQLQKVPMPSFTGNIRDYPRFKNDFEKYVLPSLENTNVAAFVLGSCLKDEPLQLVKNVEDNIKAMWNRLDEVYGNPATVVDIIMNEIKRLQPIKEDDYHALINLIDVVERGYMDLSRLKIEQEISNSQTVSIVEEKLPRDVKLAWSKKVVKSGSNIKVGNKFSELLKFLQGQRRLIEYTNADIRLSASELSKSMYYVSTFNEFACLIHATDSHSTQNCRAYLAKDAKSKLELLNSHRACHLCLKQSHFAKNCYSKNVCGKEGCTKSHHESLHEAHVQGLIFSTQMINNCGSGTCLLQLMKVNLAKSSSGKLNVLWDSGAQLCLITFRKARELGLKGRPTQLSITKVGATHESVTSYVYEVPIRDNSGSVINIEAYGINEISSEIQHVDVTQVISLFEGVSACNLERPSGFVDLLIGFNYASIHPSREMIAGNLILLSNSFGKCLGGTHKLLRERTVNHMKNATIHLFLGPSNLIQKFIESEDMGTNCIPKCGACACGKCKIGSQNCSIKEERELKLIEENMSFVGDHWEVEYPWTKDPQTLLDNKIAAEAMLRSTEKRLLKEPKLAEAYSAQMKDMMDRGVAVKLTESELLQYYGPKHYISHHEVINEEKLSTPLRIVFNASANYKGQILNDFWAKGPDLLNNPLGIVMRFREEQHAMIGDIRKMYHSVKLKPGLDWHTHRFLWRNLDTTRRPDTYVLTSPSFGDRPAGTIAAVALRKTAEMGSATYPNAAAVVQNNTYVDDIIDSFDSDETAKQCAKDISTLLQDGNFFIKEWVFSSNQKYKPEYDIACVSGENKKTSVLGCKWDRKTDSFVFSVKLNFSEKKRKVKIGPNLKNMDIPSCLPSEMSKRQILSQLSGIWDPQGFASPITVKGKILMRKLWQFKLDWDDSIPTGARKEWEKFFSELCQLEQLSFPRCMKPADAVGNPILVNFWDGSEEAYGAVSYVRWKLSNGKYACRLVVAKCRIAPMKKISVPRLELNGAVMATRLKSFIYEHLRYKFEKVYFIGDSRIVHAMVKRDSYGFNTYAGLRIGEVQESSKADEWYWIEGELNVADYVTRDKLKPSQMGKGSVWQEGPEFLSRAEEEWPIIKEASEAEIPELKKSVSHVEAVQNDSVANLIDITRFSTLNRLFYTTARIFYACKRFKGEVLPLELDASILQEAKMFWIKEAQTAYQGCLKEKSLLRLCARDENGFMYVGGRTERWMEATWNRQNFLLLPAKHRLSLLIAEDIHNSIGHLGVSSTVSKIRAEYWIPGIHNLVKQIRKNCFKCKKKFHLIENQQMSNLPIERLKPTPPFTFVGIDYFGPFVIKGEVQKRVHGKAYGVIFVCMTMRAVYVDIAANQATDSFLQVLRRFGNRHGWPAKAHSDQGTQLKAASKELKDIVSKIDASCIRKFVASKGFEWNFVPPDAPWMNGITESLVKSVKRSLNTAIGDHILTFSELQTTVFECAQLVNQRPIGRHPTEPEDGSYLCPNDLILGRSTSNIPQGPFEQGTSKSKRFRFVQSLAAAFWTKWIRDYLPNLVIRSKWHFSKREMKVGDIVFIKDVNALRGKWRIGRVTQIHPSTDNRIRKVSVLCKAFADETDSNDLKSTKMIELERAVHNLVVLVANDNDQDVDTE